MRPSLFWLLPFADDLHHVPLIGQDMADPRAACARFLTPA
jgi:hypothetical protein